jgi:hypothetical protein
LVHATQYCGWARGRGSRAAWRHLQQVRLLLCGGDLTTDNFGLGVDVLGSDCCSSFFLPPLLRPSSGWCRGSRTQVARRRRGSHAGSSTDSLAFRSTLQSLKHRRRRRRCPCSAAAPEATARSPLRLLPSLSSFFTPPISFSFLKWIHSSDFWWWRWLRIGKKIPQWAAGQGERMGAGFYRAVPCENSGKNLLHPQPIGVGTHHPQPMKMDFLPPELSNTGQITLKRF